MKFSQPFFFLLPAISMFYIVAYLFDKSKQMRKLFLGLVFGLLLVGCGDGKSDKEATDSADSTVQENTDTGDEAVEKLEREKLEKVEKAAEQTKETTDSINSEIDELTKDL